MTDAHGDDEARVTAPQQSYGMSHVVKGFIVLIIGAALTMGLPLLLT